ncbi:MAG TPA: sulfatase, partial [Candidatus Polarisedimenticolia bacterium]|nr:sulfatase [Candidatus Polarisedimenticolia bacterium]
MIAFTLASWSCGGCRGPAADGTNILLITVDSLRADHLGFAGFSGAQTPAMDQLAASGAFFTRAFTPSPEAAPALMSLHTGQYPASHGVWTGDTGALAETAVTLAEVLKTKGYRTHACASSIQLHPKFGLGQGFDAYTLAFADAPRPSAAVETGMIASKVADRALEFLETAREGTFFLWINFYDPHYFYAPPEPFESSFKDRLYDGEIAFVDRELGRILAKLKDYGLDRRTIVVLAG